MDKTTRNACLDGARATDEHVCQYGHEKYRRQSSPRIFAGVSSPPPMYSDSSESQEDEIPAGLGGPPASLESRLEEAQRKIILLQQEKKDAVRKLKEVSKMNSRWQKYDKEREVLVVKLTTQAKQAEDTVKCLEMKLADQRNRNEELELRWTDARVRAAERKSEVERIQREHETVKHALKQSEKKRQEMAKASSKEEETERCRRDAGKDRDLYHMSKRVVDLKERVDFLEKQVASHKADIDQQADLYTQQISICLDDFKHEKKDREQSQKENAELKKQLKKAEDFASSLKVQITRYQDQQRARPSRFVKPATHHVQKYYANMYDENLDSWDDAGYALPSDVVRDEPDRGLEMPAIQRPKTVAIVDPPPQYDDRSILGHVVTSPPKTYQIGRVATAQKSREDDLVLH
nr:centrosomal protein of 55 kDa-like [Lytechinus pictus]